jgi:hypothetical protein
LPQPGPCTPSDERLCLLGGRFAVTARWRDQHNREVGVGRAEPFEGSDRTGRFWFFNPDNIELIVKQLDGRAANDHFWSFYGALSDVGYWITVTDTVERRSRTYRNPPGVICGRGDASAFPEISAATGALRSGGLATPELPVIDLGPLATVLGGVAAAQDRWPAPAHEGIAAARRPLASTPAAGASGGTCQPGPAVLCLRDGRYRVEVVWHDQHNGGDGVGGAVPGTDESGYFWFFDATNVELVVKILDGTTVNGHVWVFYGGLSDVEYTITVTDTVTSTPRTYRNEPGEICGGADLAAF